MFIRSQDKNYLIDMQGAEIFIVGTEIRMSRWVEHCNTLGIYSTKEKALEVLDLIEMDYTMNCKICNMPQEDEI